MYELMSEQDPNLPKAVDYQLGDINGPRFCRVVLEVQRRQSDRVEVEAQAFEIDADKRLVVAPSGASSRTPGTTHVIEISGIAGGTHVLKPGWVRVVGDYTEDTIDPSIPHVTAKPTEPANIGAQFYDTTTGIQYRYDQGMLETIRQGKCEEMAAILAQSDALAALDL